MQASFSQPAKQILLRAFRRVDTQQVPFDPSSRVLRSFRLSSRQSSRQQGARAAKPPGC